MGVEAISRSLGQPGDLFSGGAVGPGAAPGDATALALGRPPSTGAGFHQQVNGAFKEAGIDADTADLLDHLLPWLAAEGLVTRRERLVLMRAAHPYAEAHRLARTGLERLTGDLGRHYARVAPNVLRPYLDAPFNLIPHTGSSTVGMIGAGEPGIAIEPDPVIVRLDTVQAASEVVQWVIGATLDLIRRVGVPFVVPHETPHAEMIREEVEGEGEPLIAELADKGIHPGQPQFGKHLVDLMDAYERGGYEVPLPGPLDADALTELFNTDDYGFITPLGLDTLMAGQRAVGHGHPLADALTVRAVLNRPGFAQGLATDRAWAGVCRYAVAEVLGLYARHPQLSRTSPEGEGDDTAATPLDRVWLEPEEKPIDEAAVVALGGALDEALTESLEGEFMEVPSRDHLLLTQSDPAFLRPFLEGLSVGHGLLALMDVVDGKLKEGSVYA